MDNIKELITGLKMIKEAKKAAMIGGDFLIKFPELKATFIKAIEDGELKCKKQLNKNMKWEN